MSVLFGLVCLAYFAVCLAGAYHAYTQIEGGHGAQGDPATAAVVAGHETPSFVFSWDDES